MRPAWTCRIDVLAPFAFGSVVSLLRRRFLRRSAAATFTFIKSQILFIPYGFAQK
jgi:hypothetical protein